MRRCMKYQAVVCFHIFTQRRTFCRYGCSMQQTFTTTQTSEIQWSFIILSTPYTMYPMNLNSLWAQSIVNIWINVVKRAVCLSLGGGLSLYRGHYGTKSHSSVMFLLLKECYFYQLSDTNLNFSWNYLCYGITYCRRRSIMAPSNLTIPTNNPILYTLFSDTRLFSIIDTIPGPIAAPLITCHTNSSSTSKLFVVNITDAMPTEENHQALKNVSYLYKIQQGNDVSYIWQVNFGIQKLY